MSIAVAVILPCYNEARTIGRTITSIRQTLPGAAIWVCDNNSTDDTAAAARQSGAIVITERAQGKGSAVRRLFTTVEADVYVLIDGDDTYDISRAPEMISLLVEERLAMVTGTRQGNTQGQYRRGHRTANQIFTSLFRRLFGGGVTDIFSGYRVMSRRFVKTFPARSRRFEIETELSAHAALYRLPTAEVETRYSSRPEGSVSKLHSFRDGTRILLYYFLFLKDLRPLQFFTVLSALFFALSGGLSIPLFVSYFATGLVPYLPTAMVVVGLSILGFLFFTSGLVLHTIRHAAEADFVRAYNAIPDVTT